MDNSRARGPANVHPQVHRPVDSLGAAQGIRGAHRVLVSLHSGQRDPPCLRDPHPGPHLHPRAKHGGIYLYSKPRPNLSKGEQSS